MGASEFTDYYPLPAVPVELSMILSTWSGKSFLNEEFTLDNLKQARDREAFAIVHLATHGQFNPGHPDNSYIQLRDVKLGLNALREIKWNAPPVELLVLSACRTAVGDRNAELGFAGLAVQAGVKSALASVWSVSDEGTLGLMSEFYHHLHEAPIKVEALRQAQIAMIRGEVRIESGYLITSHARIPLPPELAYWNDLQLSHPHYWAGFAAIGSPW